MCTENTLFSMPEVMLLLLLLLPPKLLLPHLLPVLVSCLAADVLILLLQWLGCRRLIPAALLC